MAAAGAQSYHCTLAGAWSTLPTGDKIKIKIKISIATAAAAGVRALVIIAVIARIVTMLATVPTLFAMTAWHAGIVITTIFTLASTISFVRAAEAAGMVIMTVVALVSSPVPFVRAAMVARIIFAIVVPLARTYIALVRTA